MLKAAVGKEENQNYSLFDKSVEKLKLRRKVKLFGNFYKVCLIIVLIIWIIGLNYCTKLTLLGLLM